MKAPLDRPAMIELRDVSLDVDGTAVLRGITVSADQRRIGVVGRNGSGKSTLLRVLCGLIAVRGQVRVAGVDVARDRRGALDAVGLLFQNPEHQIIFPTVAEELVFGLRQQGATQSAAARAATGMLARFGCADWADRAVHDLSHGQKQLVCLMAILAMAPQVILLDEPFAGLDLPLRMRLARVLEGLESTLVHVSHAPDDLRGYDRIIWLEGGRVAADGGDEVLEAYTAEMHRLGAPD